MTGGERSVFRVGLVLLVFFVISLLTNVVGPLVPDIIRSFRLSLVMVAFLPFAFFIAYGVMSIPAGMLVDRFGEKPILVGAFAAASCGALLFALVPRYPTAILSLFVIGCGMAALQVAINPLLRLAGGEEHFAFYSVLGQLFFGAASFLSPIVYSVFVRTIGTPAGERNPLLRTLGRLVPPDLAWISIYWVLAAVTLVMTLLLSLTRLPGVRKKEDEKTGNWAAYGSLLRRKAVILYFLGIVAYVGTEQGIANWISQFLSVYHHYDPRIVGAKAVSGFWGLMTIGCVLGLVLLKFIDSRKILVAFSAAAVILLSVGLFGPGPAALWAFPLTGFAASVMWSIIFSLALNSVRSLHGSFSGILCTGIIGGALVPLIIGGLGDRFGLRQGMCFLYLTLAYVLSIGLWARPLVNNATFAGRTKSRAPAETAALG